jgi:hypothetical protein
VRSASSVTTPMWLGKQRNTFCVTSKARWNKGGPLDCPPSETGGQSIGY